MHTDCWRSLVVFIGCSIAGPLAAFGQANPSLREYYHAADVVLVARRAYVEPPTRDDAGSIAETVHVLRDRSGSCTQGARLQTNELLPAGSDELVLLFGHSGTNQRYQEIERKERWCATCFRDQERSIPFHGMRWKAKYVAVTPALLAYLVEFPELEDASEKRLRYCGTFLECKDHKVAAEAFLEFSNAFHEGIPSNAGIPRAEALRKWLNDSKVPVVRQCVYGLMLGLHGNADDADLLQRRIIDTDEDRRLGIEWVMAGYLLIAGEPGLKWLETTILRKPSVTLTDKIAVMHTVGYLRDRKLGGIAPERLAAAVRLLVDDDDLILPAAIQLSRFKDWSAQSRMMHIYGTRDFDDRSSKSVIIRYIVAASKDGPEGPQERTPQHVIDGLMHLQQLRNREPKLVESVEKEFSVR